MLTTSPALFGIAHAVARPHASSGPWVVVATATMWMTMMVAMMLPPVLPWIALFTSTRRDRDGRQPFGDTSVFVSGYFSVWAPFCVVAAMAQIALSAGMHGAQADLGPVGSRAGGSLLVLAGLYQFSPLKAACLRHCRSPLGFFLTRWVDGPAGAWRMGATHGLYCLGCCWALMAVSFAVGVMNVVWMGVLTVVMSIEKIAPMGRGLGRVFGLGLILWGSVLAMMT
jgi:predicted metal-binding membrane protein